MIKEMFLNYFYGGMDEFELKIIDVFICKLWKKIIIVIGGECLIEIVWGCGYVLCDFELVVELDCLVIGV